jgi:hypothetical protein
MIEADLGIGECFSGRAVSPPEQRSRLLRARNFEANLIGLILVEAASENRADSRNNFAGRRFIPRALKSVRCDL